MPIKRISLFLLLCCLGMKGLASHIVGGEVFYTYLGPGTTGNSSRYQVSLRLFIECGQVCGGGTQVACPPTTVLIGIFDNAAPYNRITNLSMPRSSQNDLNLTTYSPCLVTNPVVCYTVYLYQAEVTLNNTTTGYRFSYQNCCRAQAVNVLNNASSVTGTPGAAYESILPGTNTLPTGTNSNAVVNLKDTALICPEQLF